MRFTGQNTSATDYTLRAQSVLEAKSYSIGPGTAAVPATFDFYVADDQAPEIQSQLDGCSGVTYEKRSALAHATLETLGAPAALSNTAVHASIAGNNSTSTFTSGITNPAVPRNVIAVFAASWDGGNITVTGTDQFNAPVSEVITASAGSTVAGVKVFKTVTSIAKSAVGASGDGCSIGIGNKLGIAHHIVSGAGILFVTGATDTTATFDATYNAVTPSSGVVPNASRVYQALVNV